MSDYNHPRVPKWAVKMLMILLGMVALFKLLEWLYQLL